MQFNSFEFIFIFLPITFCVYFYLKSIKINSASRVFLILANLTFYSIWNISYLPLIIGSVLFNYYIGLFLIENRFKKKLVLIFGIFVNLLILGYFKYTDFLIENYNILTSSEYELLHIALPLAISFFTFQQIAYIVDCYRGNIRSYNFLNYALFVTFFPQLIAGPIAYYKEIVPQFTDKKSGFKNYENIYRGLFIFAIGLFKKVIIADTFAVWANSGFDTSATLTLLEAWSSSLSYTFQLYYDFSGYTDMAIGIGLLFNIKLPINFNSPYKALNIQDFWRRWHITLSRFLKDYIYIPLGGSRRGEYKTYINILITFILAGIWHGAGWTFLFWGFLHGFGLIVYKIWSRFGVRLYSWLGWFITFNFINITWVFFRAKNFDDALRVLSGMVNFDLIGSYNLINFSWIVVAMFAIFIANSNEIIKSKISYRVVLSISSLLIFVSIFQLVNIIIATNTITKFLYFDF